MIRVNNTEFDETAIVKEMQYHTAETHTEAKNAKNALENSHFYGRHLIIQFSKNNNNNTNPNKKRRLN